MRRRICVFCGSSSGIRPSYTAVAAAVGRRLAAHGIGVVYGGGRNGLMGTVADAALEADGEVIGVIPRHLAEREAAHPGVADLRIVGSMHERKALMSDLADAFLALPGGFGTFEEFCEIITWTQLGLHRKPCGILNVDGYYDHLLALFDHAVCEQFLKPLHRQIVISGDDPEALIARLLEYQAPVLDKLLDADET
jgi:uncharacterized protein (TIGR00730 family)